MPDATILPPAPAGPVDDAEAWRLPRHLTGAAVAVVAAVLVLCGLLAWWGGLNPRVDGWLSTSSATGSRAVDVTLRLHNAGQTEATVTGLTLEAPLPLVPPPADVDGSTVAVPVTDAVVVPVERTGPRAPGWRLDDPRATSLPTTIEPGEEVAVTFTWDAYGCAGGVWGWTGSLGVTTTLESSVGRTVQRTDTAPLSVQVDCAPPLPPLPPESAPPTDRAEAAQAATDSVGIAYDANLPTDLRISRIEDGQAVADAMADLPETVGVDLSTLRARVTDISFDRPGHAAIAYTIENSSGLSMPRTGEVVLVGGTWKVARATVCADLAMAGVTCPPRPR